MAKKHPAKGTGKTTVPTGGMKGTPTPPRNVHK